MSPRFRSTLYPRRPGRRPLTTVPQVVLAPMAPRRTSPALSTLPDGDLELVRCHELDAVLLVTVMGRVWPADLVRTRRGRVRSLAPFVPPGAVLTGRAAVWLHTGYGPPPGRLTICSTPRTAAGPLVDVSRTSMDRSDQCLVEGMRVCTLARAAVDVARLAPTRRAVEVLLVALAHGETRSSLSLALMHCRGGGGVGRPRATRLIDAVADLGPSDQAGPADPAHAVGPAEDVGGLQPRCAS